MLCSQSDFCFQRIGSMFDMRELVMREYLGNDISFNEVAA